MYLNLRNIQKYTVFNGVNSSNTELTLSVSSAGRKTFMFRQFAPKMKSKYAVKMNKKMGIIYCK